MPQNTRDAMTASFQQTVQQLQIAPDLAPGIKLALLTIIGATAQMANDISQMSEEVVAAAGENRSRLDELVLITTEIRDLLNAAAAPVPAPGQEPYAGHVG